MLRGNRPCHDLLHALAAKAEALADPLQTHAARPLGHDAGVALSAPRPEVLEAGAGGFQDLRGDFRRRLEPCGLFDEEDGSPLENGHRPLTG